jgi:hypothetical protein
MHQADQTVQYYESSSPSWTTNPGLAMGSGEKWQKTAALDRGRLGSGDGPRGRMWAAACMRAGFMSVRQGERSAKRKKKQLHMFQRPFILVMEGSASRNLALFYYYYLLPSPASVFSCSLPPPSDNTVAHQGCGPPSSFEFQSWWTLHIPSGRLVARALGSGRARLGFQLQVTGMSKSPPFQRICLAPECKRPFHPAWPRVQ